MRGRGRGRGGRGYRGGRGFGRGGRANYEEGPPAYVTGTKISTFYMRKLSRFCLRCW